MPRIPYRDPDGAPEPIREVISQTPLALLGIVGYADTAFEPWLRYSNTLLRKLALDPLLRELAILQVAHLSELRVRVDPARADRAVLRRERRHDHGDRGRPRRTTRSSPTSTARSSPSRAKWWSTAPPASRRWPRCRPGSESASWSSCCS